jgi:hypothetical protein
MNSIATYQEVLYHLRVRRLFFIFFLLLPLFAFSQNPPSQRELNGFLLLQRHDGIQHGFGLKKLMQSRTFPDGWVEDVYRLNEAGTTYMAFGFERTGNESAIALQLTGEPSPDVLPFLGLNLGDPKQTVIEKLGPPTKTQREKDFPVDLYTYEDRNYSVEIDEQGLLYSIRLTADSGFSEKSDGIPNLEPLKSALLAHDVNRLLEAMSGDCEIYVSKGEFLAFDGAARAVLSDPDSKMRTKLTGPGPSVLQVLANPEEKSDAELRLTEHQPLMTVFKFPDSKNLREIVSRWELGAFRVYEIALR